MKKSRYKRNKKQRKEETKKERISFFRKLILTILFIVLLTGAYSYFIAPNKLIVRDIKVVNSNLPQSFNGLRIVHFTDMHYGAGYNEERLKKLIPSINELNPDVVVFTGDLADDKFKINDDKAKMITEYLSKINSKYGKYAIVGNHDIDCEKCESILKNSEFKLLKNSFDTVYNTSNEQIAIYGFDDVLRGTPKTDELKSKTIKDIKYKIVLLHEPDYIDKFLNDFEISLVLSGHSHGGQVRLPKIRPFFLPEGAKTYYNDHYLVDNTDVYISNGIGSSILDVRLFSTPSINLYRIYTK